MFGYIQANLNDLSQQEKERYRAAYCGLCRTLGEKHGISSKLALSYDLTFVALLRYMNLKKNPAHSVA